MYSKILEKSKMSIFNPNPKSNSVGCKDIVQKWD